MYMFNNNPVGMIVALAFDTALVNGVDPKTQLYNQDTKDKECR